VAWLTVKRQSAVSTAADKYDTSRVFGLQTSCRTGEGLLKARGRCGVLCRAAIILCDTGHVFCGMLTQQVYDWDFFQVALSVRGCA
jgi:hypothetical protein